LQQLRSRNSGSIRSASQRLEYADHRFQGAVVSVNNLLAKTPTKAKKLEGNWRNHHGTTS
jgi:hypothetical protein